MRFIQQDEWDRSSSLLVGWEGKTAPAAGRSLTSGREDGRAKKRSLLLDRLLEKFCSDYAAVDFFAALVCGLAVAFCAALAFSFVANSCLTFAVMASISTL